MDLKKARGCCCITLLLWRVSPCRVDISKEAHLATWHGTRSCKDSARSEERWQAARHGHRPPDRAPIGDTLAAELPLAEVSEGRKTMSGAAGQRGSLLRPPPFRTIIAGLFYRAQPPSKRTAGCRRARGRWVERVIQTPPPHAHSANRCA